MINLSLCMLQQELTLRVKCVVSGRRCLSGTLMLIPLYPWRTPVTDLPCEGPRTEVPWFVACCRDVGLLWKPLLEGRLPGPPPRHGAEAVPPALHKHRAGGDEAAAAVSLGPSGSSRCPQTSWLLPHQAPRFEEGDLHCWVLPMQAASVELSGSAQSCALSVGCTGALQCHSD